MARVNIICFYNSHGLAKDGQLMASILESNGNQVIQSDLKTPSLALRLGRKVSYAIKRRPIYDVNIHVESCVPSLFHLARRNILVPNLEALRPQAAEYLHYFDAIFCKTQEAHLVFASQGLPAIMVGFSSPPRRTKGQFRDWRRFFHASGVHVPGGISVKGTASIYRVWNRHPEWPVLTITGCHYPSSTNIICLKGYIPENKYTEMQDSSGIHMCPSEMEGFGHYIAEPMSAGCVVVTTDGAPMNELVDSTRGYLVKSTSSIPYMFGRRYSIDEVSLEETIQKILHTSTNSLQVLGENARAWYRQNDFSFRTRFLQTMNEIIAR